MDNKSIKLSGDPKIDFPELFENKIDNDDDLKSNNDKFLNEINLENEYIKKKLIEELKENIEIKKDNSISDKRLKKSLFKKMVNAIFQNDRI